MKLIGITVCINYADFLKETLPLNMEILDQLIVVTAPTDQETRNLCIDPRDSYGVRPDGKKLNTVLTTEHLRDGAAFNKGAAINEGLEVLYARVPPAKETMVCHIDADTILPIDMKSHLEKRLSEPGFCSDPKKFLYGMQRSWCHSKEEFNKYLATRDNNFLPREFDRTSAKNLIVGFFQAWSILGQHYYPEQYSTAATSDLEFAKMFRYKIFLPCRAIHLATPGHVWGRDHRGRVSARW